MAMKLAGRVTIYSITGCPHCKAAKAKLESLELPFFEINLDDHPEERYLFAMYYIVYRYQYV